MAISGLKYPLEINSLGRFAVIDESEKLLQNMRMIANTALRERWYEPNYGSTGYSALFANISTDTMQMVARLVQDAINELEPRVQAQIVPATTVEEGTMVFDIRWIRKDTRTAHTSELTLTALGV